jgi:chromatin assembly factor 1 subunit B
MKVETPQILWNDQLEIRHSTDVKRLSYSAAALLSVSMSGPVLATAGNSKQVNLWRVGFSEEHDNDGSMFVQQSRSKIEYLYSLSRHHSEAAANVVRFSPNGCHLAAAGDAGAVIIYSLPPQASNWSSLTSEKELQVKIVSATADGITDLSWSADSKRILVGSIDHSFFVLEDVSLSTVEQDAAMPTSEEPLPTSTSTPDANSEWRMVFRSTGSGLDHKNYVQGVAYDPLGVYLATMSSDRTVQIVRRKCKTLRKKLARTVSLPDEQANTLAPNDINSSPEAPPRPLCHWPPPEQAAGVQQFLTESKFELDSGAAAGAAKKVIKWRSTTPEQKQYIFCDESTMTCFFRRLAWTHDGAYLITPAAVWQTTNANNQTAPTFATCLFARHQFEQCYRVLPGLEKVRHCAVLHHSFDIY